LGLEVLVCFVPACALFLTIAAASEAGRMPPADALLYLSAAAIGPLGLAVGGLLVVRNRSIIGRVPAGLLTVAAVWTFLAFCEHAGGALAAFSQSWREFVLIVLLPAGCSAHLLTIALHRKDPPVPI
jgi:hypothetical protein